MMLLDLLLMKFLLKCLSRLVCKHWERVLAVNEKRAKYGRYWGQLNQSLAKFTIKLQNLMSDALEEMDKEI